MKLTTNHVIRPAQPSNYGMLHFVADCHCEPRPLPLDW